MTRSLLPESCDRRSERGFALISVLVISVLFFFLIQLMMVEAQTQLRGAVRHGSRVTAQMLAENAAELAALNMINTSSTAVDRTTDDGTMTATYQTFPGETAGETAFVIAATGRSTGAQPVEATVTVYGRFGNNWVTVDRTVHSQ